MESLQEHVRVFIRSNYSGPTSPKACPAPSLWSRQAGCLEDSYRSQPWALFRLLHDCDVILAASVMGVRVFGDFGCLVRRRNTVVGVDLPLLGVLGYPRVEVTAATRRGFMRLDVQLRPASESYQVGGGLFPRAWNRRPRNEVLPELRERAGRMAFDHAHEYPSQWAAIRSIAEKLGCTSEAMRHWVRRGERDARKVRPRRKSPFVTMGYS